jgi:hypothetical protein
MKEIAEYSKYSRSEACIETRYPDQGAVGGPGQRGGGREGGEREKERERERERASDKATLRPYLKHSCQQRRIAEAAVILSTKEIAGYS